MGRKIKFGPFELDRQTGELWKQGIKLKLQGKPFQLLEALLDRPGEPVSREELQQRLWPGDTFVDFESGLNTAANRLRLTLGDSAEHPSYIETLARSGYRFIAQVEEGVAPPPPASGTRVAWWNVAAALVLVMGVSFWLTSRRPKESPDFREITFRRGTIAGARFAPDGQNILYSAKWGSQPWRLFMASSVSPETRSLGFEDLKLGAVSSAGELLLLSSPQMGLNGGNSLSRVPLNGGAPLMISSRVICADWSRDGKQFAIARFDGRETDVEFPVGKILYRTGSLLSCLRISPDGSTFAFIEHPARGDDAGNIRLLDLMGRIRTVSDGWGSASGLAWSPSGKEIWFTAARAGLTRSLWSVSVAGKLRLVARIPGSLMLEDISRQGRVLVIREDRRLEMAGRIADDSSERELSWFDWTGAQDLSADGKTILFDESGDGGGENWTAYLRGASDSSTVRLGEGHALALAPDGGSAIILKGADRRRLTVVPVGEGPQRDLSGGNIEYHWARYLPDGKRLLVAGNPPEAGLRLYLQFLEGGKPQPLVPEVYVRTVIVSPDGKWIAGANEDTRLVVCGLENSERRLIHTPQPVLPVAWSADGASVLVRDLGAIPVTLYHVDLRTGRVNPWKTIGPANSTGVDAVFRMFYTPDEKSYVYSYERNMAELYITDGWK